MTSRVSDLLSVGIKSVNFFFLNHRGQHGLRCKIWKGSDRVTSGSLLLITHSSYKHCTFFSVPGQRLLLYRNKVVKYNEFLLKMAPLIFK